MPFRHLVLLASLAWLGCGPSDQVTWSKDIVPLVEQRCVRCHQEGGSGSFSLETYDSASANHVLLADAVMRANMPPWLPVLGCTKLKGEEQSYLPPEQRATLQKWLTQKTPAGDKKVRPKTQMIPTLETASQSLNIQYDPAGHAWHAAEDVRCYRLSLNQTQTRQLTAFDVRPKTAQKVSAVSLYRVSAEQANRLPTEFECDLQPGFVGAVSPTAFGDGAYLGGWQSGNGPLRWPEGTGLTLKPDDQVVARFVYHPLAKGLDVEVTRLDFVYADHPVSELHVQTVSARDFVIPARASNYVVTASSPVPNAGKWWGVAPHMRARGRSLRLAFQNPCLLDVGKFDNLWQTAYWFADGAISVTATTALDLKCTYDNSTTDLTVKQGDGPLDELCAATIYWSDAP